MDKIAELVRDSEIHGAVAAFVDAGLVKVASVDAFDDLAETVANVIGDEDYDIQKVAAVTDYVVTHEHGLRKIAGRPRKTRANILSGRAEPGTGSGQGLSARQLEEAARKRGAAPAAPAGPVSEAVASAAPAAPAAKAAEKAGRLDALKNGWKNLSLKGKAGVVGGSLASLVALACGGKKAYDHYRYC